MVPWGRSRLELQASGQLCYEIQGLPLWLHFCFKFRPICGSYTLGVSKNDGHLLLQHTMVSFSAFLLPRPTLQEKPLFHVLRLQVQPV
jgi:hypothetical protein